MNTFLNNPNNFNDTVKLDRLNSRMLLSKIVAHDFNNLLTMIFGNVSLAKLYIDEKDKVIELLGNVEQTCEHAQILLQHMSEPYSSDTKSTEKINVEKIIRFTTKLCLNFPEIKSEISCSENLWPINTDEVEIIQVLTNLFLNSIQALPDGGIVRIEAENVIMDVTNTKLKKGRYVRITVKDNGVGISDENLPKIFNMYYTTKKDGNGLGLFIIKDIITKQNGYISVVSKEDNGTTFSIYLPAFNGND